MRPNGQAAALRTALRLAGGPLLMGDEALRTALSPVIHGSAAVVTMEMRRPGRRRSEAAVGRIRPSSGELKTPVRRSSSGTSPLNRASATYMRMSARVRSRGSIGTIASSWAPSELARSGAELAPELTPEDTPEDAPQRCLTSLRLVSTSSEMSSREVWSSRSRMESSEFEKGSSAEALKRERLTPDEGCNQHAISMQSAYNQHVISM